MIDQVQAELSAFYERGALAVAELEPDGPDLWQQLQTAGRGGKYLRPQVLLETHTACHGRQHQQAIRLAAAVELLHTAFVIHDDVIDDDHIRRGQLNVSGHFIDRATGDGSSSAVAHQLGTTAAILAGDLALTGAVEMAATCGADSATTRTLLALLHQAVSVSAAGELADVRLSTTERAPLAEVLQMTRAKTAPYSFALPMQWGALLAGAPSDQTSQLARAGEHLGLAFQLRDDLLGSYCDQDRTGKDALCDLREGKRTALIAYAAATDHWPALAPLVGDADLGPAGLEQARELLLASGATQFVAELAEAELARAAELLTETDLPEHYTHWLLSVPQLPQRSAA